VQRTFQVDQQRRTDAALWVSAYCANATRIDSVMMSLNGIRATVSGSRPPPHSSNYTWRAETVSRIQVIRSLELDCPVRASRAVPP
jgi:hypothetical protein